MVLASVSYGQNNSQLGFICVFKTNPNLLEVVAKVNMRQNSAEVFNWDTETFDRRELRQTINYISLWNPSSNTNFYIDRTSLDGGRDRNSDTHGCSVNTWSEVDAFIQRKISRLNETRAF